MKHEQCKNCTQSKFREVFRILPGFIGFLFGTYRTYEHQTIYCTELHTDINPDDYYLICNTGCGSFKDNNIKKE